MQARAAPPSIKVMVAGDTLTFSRNNDDEVWAVEGGNLLGQTEQSTVHFGDTLRCPGKGVKSAFVQAPGDNSLAAKLTTPRISCSGRHYHLQGGALPGTCSGPRWAGNNSPPPWMEGSPFRLADHHLRDHAGSRWP